MKPYYEKDGITLYCGDCQKVLRFVIQKGKFDCAIVDPPSESTSLEWDKWQDGWASLLSHFTNNMWVFGSMLMFWKFHHEFEDWKIAQEIVWEKQNGSSFINDKFRRVHELAVHFYGSDEKWGDIYKNPVFTNDAVRKTVRTKEKPPHMGARGPSTYTSMDGGPRLMRSVIKVPNCHGYAVHPTQKPEGVIRPLLQYSVPNSGIVLDPFCGSGTTLVVAKSEGIRAIGIEISEKYCEEAVARLQQSVMVF